MSSFSPTDLQYMQSHRDDNRSGQIYAANVVCAFAAYLAVLLRLVARSLTKANHGLDDLIICAGLVRKNLHSRVRLITEPSPDPVHRLCHLEQPYHSLWYGKTHHTGDQRKGLEHCDQDSYLVLVGNAHQHYRHWWPLSASIMSRSR